MNVVLIAAFLAAAIPAPTTSEKIAIQALEQRKTDAKKQWDDAMQSERAIAQEFSLAHPGFHINFNTMQVEADVKADKGATNGR